MQTSSTSSTSLTGQCDQSEERTSTKRGTKTIASSNEPNYYNDKVATINTYIENFRLQYLFSLHEVCKAVQNIDFCAIKHCSAWNTCNLTGELCAESVHFTSNGVAYNVHVRFKHFITCLWLSTHIHDLIEEQKKEFQNNNSLQASQTRIQTQAQHAKEELEKGFEEAYEFVCKIMCKSLHTETL